MYSCQTINGSTVNYQAAATRKIFSELLTLRTVHAIEWKERGDSAWQSGRVLDAEGGGGMIYRFIFVGSRKSNKTVDNNYAIIV